MSKFAILGAVAMMLAGCGAGNLNHVVPKASAIQASAAKGSLSVSFAGLPKYQVLATMNDVASVRLDLSVFSGDVAASQTRTLSRKQLDANGVVTFSQVAPGKASLTVTALGADGKELGRNNTSAAVTAGRTTRMPVTIDLRSKTGNVEAAVTFLTDDTVSNCVVDGTCVIDPPPPVPQPTPKPVPVYAQD